jgi:hypothetical protein
LHWHASMPLFPKPGASACLGQNEHGPAPYVQKCTHVSEDYLRMRGVKVGKRWGRRRGEHRLILVFPRGTKHTRRGLSRNRLQCVRVLHGIASTRTPNTFSYLFAQIFVPHFLPDPPRMHVHIHMWARICPCCSHLTRSAIGVQRRPLRIGGADLWSASDQAGIQSSRGHCQSPTRTHA